MPEFDLSAERIAAENDGRLESLQDDYDHLGLQLARRNVDIEALTERAPAFRVAVPSWGVGTGGTRFARFPGPGEPRNVFEKIEDCEVVFKLVRSTPGISLHIPWDRPENRLRLRDVRRVARALHRVDELEHVPGPARPAALVQIRQPRARRRRPCGVRPIEHNIECLQLGLCLGARSHTVWIGDGGNFPGQLHFRRALDRYLDSLRAIYEKLPAGWRLFLEHKPYEPAFYSTVLGDWGTSYYCARELGPRAFSLVDLGHHVPNTNIEQIVARLIQFGKLGGFHFNDSKYGDDDLDAGSVKPFQLFLVFNELVGCGAGTRAGFRSGLHARSVAQRDRSDRVADDERHRARSGVRAGAPGRPRGACRASGGERSADGAADAESRRSTPTSARFSRWRDIAPAVRSTRWRSTVPADIASGRNGRGLPREEPCGHRVARGIRCVSR